MIAVGNFDGTFVERHIVRCYKERCTFVQCLPLRLASAETIGELHIPFGQDLALTTIICCTTEIIGLANARQFRCQTHLYRPFIWSFVAIPNVIHLGWDHRGIVVAFGNWRHLGWRSEIFGLHRRSLGN